MATTLAGFKVNESFAQLLHISGGPVGEAQYVYSGLGVATALRLGTVSGGIADISIEGHTISSEDELGRMAIDASILTLPDIEFADPEQARAALELSEFGTMDPDDVAITGGSVRAGTIGFTENSFGEVTQPTSKSTNVTLNAVSGRIIMDAEALSGDTAVLFSLINNQIDDNDLVVVNLASGSIGSYTLRLAGKQSGSAAILLRNDTGSPISEAVQILFAVIKVG
jgi:hypothetical protein